MKVLVRKFPDGSRSYTFHRKIGDNHVAHYLALRSEQKLTEADVLGARKALSAKLLVQMRLPLGQVNPGEGG